MSYSDKADDCSKIAIKLGWDWFKYHAEQRMLMIRYYLIVLGICMLSYTQIFKYSEEGAAAIAVFLAVLSIVFWAMDRRVSKLIKIGEQVLNEKQKKLKEELGYKEILITQLADKNVGIFSLSYSNSLRIMFIFVILLATTAAIYSLS